jgi:uncharacterized protein
VTSNIKVRQPSFDFAGVPPVWGSNLDAVHRMNATGMIPAYIEPYLIKVLRRAKVEIDPVQFPDLVEDIDAFVRQEAQHYKVHASLNKVIREAGYDRMVEFEERYAADYKSFFDKSLRWQLAYCDGFEAAGSAAAHMILSERAEEQFGEHVDRRPIELWQWHLAEEYEHRNVVFQTYHALYGHQPVRAWLARIYGFVYCARHLAGHINSLKEYLVEADLSRMTPAERGNYQTQRRAARWDRRDFRARLRDLRQSLRILRVFSPFYDPKSIPPPPQFAEVLALYGDGPGGLAQEPRLHIHPSVPQPPD